MKAADKAQLISLLETYREESGSSDAEHLISLLKRRSRAGRKPKFSNETAQIIVRLHEEGAPIRKISAITGCSIGYIQKFLKDNETTIHIHTKER